MNFVRGQDPKETMGIGRDAILKEIGGVILGDGEIESWKAYREIGVDLAAPGDGKVSKYNFKNKNVIIGITKGSYKILDIRFRYDGPKEGEEKDFITALLKIQEAFRKWDPNDFFMPIAQKIAARTIGMDLVAVKPLSGPIGHIAYFDYRYKKQNIFQKIFKRIFPTKPSKKPNI